MTKKFFNGMAFAHRGLHDNKTTPENSLPAIQKAVENGYGIEFDVYLTDDGTLIVHHDQTLRRSCGIDKKTETLTADELASCKLFNTQHTIPTLDQVLDIVDGKVKLIIEIKITKKYKETCQAVVERLKNYKGEYCLESFDPKTVKWLINHCPDLIIGQLYDANPIQRLYCKAMGTHKKIDFMAASILTLRNRFYRKTKSKYPGTAIVTWTVRTPMQQKTAMAFADNYIFECNEKDSSYIEKP